MLGTNTPCLRLCAAPALPSPLVLPTPLLPHRPLLRPWWPNLPPWHPTFLYGVQSPSTCPPGDPLSDTTYVINTALGAAKRGSYNQVWQRWMTGLCVLLLLPWWGDWWGEQAAVL